MDATHEIIIAVIAGFVTLIGMVFKLIIDLRTVHIATNSMKDALVAATDKLARLEGIAIGRQQMVDEAAAREKAGIT